MPRPARPWFRMYSEGLENSKLMTLPPDLFKLYVSLLMVANRIDPRGSLPTIERVAYIIHWEVAALKKACVELGRRGFLDGKQGHYQIHDWLEWQPDSDADRTPGRARNRGGNAGVTRGNGGDSADVARPRSRSDPDGEEDSESDPDRVRARSDKPPETEDEYDEFARIRAAIEAPRPSKGRRNGAAR